MKQDIPPEHFTAHDQRDQKVIRYGLLAMGILFSGYLLAAFMGWLPRAITPGRQEVQTATEGLSNPYLKNLPQPIDPEPYLGVAYKGSRFRFDFAKQEAIVTRPDFQSENAHPRSIWIIPASVSYKGQSYTVTTLSATALLYADGITSVTFPPTLRNFNGAHELIKPELKTIILQRLHEAPLVLTPTEFISYIQTHYPQRPLIEGDIQ